MARPLRIEYPGACYHVTHRGNAGAPVFADVTDAQSFLALLGVARSRFTLRIHAFCLMPDHYQLLLQTPEANLSRAIQWINVSHAVQFNRRHQRNGHLFQGRYAAVVVEKASYLLPLSRIVHLTPVSAGLVQFAAAYRWSSYRALIGREEPPQWLDTQWLLSQFGPRPHVARHHYRRFVENPDPRGPQWGEKLLPRRMILGSEAFVDRIRATRSPAGADAAGGRSSPTTGLSDIAAAVAGAFDCTEAAIRTPGKKRHTARDVAIYLAKTCTDMSGKALGAYFGGVTDAAVTMRYKAVANRMEQDNALARQIAALKRQLPSG